MQFGGDSGSGALLGSPLNQLPQGKDTTPSVYAILKKLPERNTQLATRLLQAQEAVPAAAAQVASRAGTDLARLRPLPHIPLHQIVLQRQVRVLQHQQQFCFLRVHPRQRLVQLHEARALQKQRVELAIQLPLLPRRGRQPVVLQSLVVVPDLIPHALQRLVLRGRQRHYTRHVALGVQPAQPMQVAQQLELPGVVADDRLVHVQVVNHQAAPQRRLGDELARLLAADAPTIELLLPLGLAMHDDRPGPDQFLQTFLPTLRKLIVCQVFQGIVTDHVLVVRDAQQLQKVDAAFGRRGGEGREQFVADAGGVVVLAAVPGRGVVAVQVAGDRAGRRQQRVFLGMKGVVTFVQNAVDLTGRNLHTVVEQLLADERLRHVVLIVLVQDVRPQRGSEVAVHVRGQCAGDDQTVGQAIDFAAVAGVAIVDVQVLHDEIALADFLGVRGQVGGREQDGLVNVQCARLVDFGGAGAFAVGRGFGLGRGGFGGGLIATEHTGLARRTGGSRWQPLQAIDLFAQPIILILQPLNDTQKLLNKRSLLGLRNLKSQRPSVGRVLGLHGALQNNAQSLGTQGEFYGFLRTQFPVSSMNSSPSWALTLILRPISTSRLPVSFSAGLSRSAFRMASISFSAASSSAFAVALCTS